MFRLRGDVRVAQLDAVRHRCVEAYDLVERLPRGDERAVAWCAYALQVYGDKLVDATAVAGSIPNDVAEVAYWSFELAARCLESGEAPESLPRWRTPVRTQEQLVGMRNALTDLQTFLAFDVSSLATDRFEAMLEAIDADLRSVERLWIPRPPAEIRGGIGDTLVRALDRAYALGRDVAL